MYTSPAQDAPFSFFKSEFTVIDWYIYWHLHHYRHGKFTGTVWKYWNLASQTSETWQIVISATNLFWYITRYGALIFTTWRRDTQTPHNFRWGQINIIFQPDDLKSRIFKISHLREANRLNSPFQKGHRRSDSQENIHCKRRHAARHQKVKQSSRVVSNGHRSLDFPISTLNCTWSEPIIYKQLTSKSE